MSTQVSGVRIQLARWPNTSLFTQVVGRSTRCSPRCQVLESNQPGGQIHHCLHSWWGDLPDVHPGVRCQNPISQVAKYIIVYTGGGAQGFSISTNRILQDFQMSVCIYITIHASYFTHRGYISFCCNSCQEQYIWFLTCFTRICCNLLLLLP